MPTADELDKIIEAGLYAANGHGSQSSIIVAVTNKNVRAQLSTINCQIGGWKKGFDPFYGAPVILIVLVPKDGANGPYDGSLVIGNMLLAAHALGLGSIWINRAKEEFELPEYQKLLQSLGIEGEWAGIGHCALGYIDGAIPKAAKRKEGRVFWIK